MISVTSLKYHPVIKEDVYEDSLAKQEHLFMWCWMKKAENKWSLWHDNNDLENIQDCVKVLEGSKKVKTVDM